MTADLRSATACPRCTSKSEVLETREAPYGARRYRRCLSCGERWTTCEITAEAFKALVTIGDVVSDLRALIAHVPKLDLAARHLSRLNRRGRSVAEPADVDGPEGDPDAHV